MSSTLQRQIRLVYDALDSGSNKSAIVSANKLLKKYPQNDLVKALKALALVRTQKVDESVVLCDEVLASKTTDDATLSAMTHVLRGLGRHNDVVIMFENAFKRQPTNEELGAQTFFAHVRTGNWKSAQQVATKMHRQFHYENYLYWSVMSAVLQANDPGTPPNMRKVLYKLAHRLITSSSEAHYNAERVFLHLIILRELGEASEARSVTSTNLGKFACATSLACNEVRRDIQRSQGLFKEEAERARQRIVEQQDRNWLEFLSVIDAIFVDIDISQSEGVPNLSESRKQECIEEIAETSAFFSHLVTLDGSKERSGLLALLELEKRARVYGLSTDDGLLVQLMERYFQEIGDKACCYGDLKPYLRLENEDLSRWTRFLESFSTSSPCLDLQRSINIHKLLRYNLQEDQLTPSMETARIAQYVKEYVAGLKSGADLPDTELQPADDLIILAGNALVTLWQLTGDEIHLHTAAAVLEFAITKSKHAFRIKLLLIRIYRLIGAPSLALGHYRLLDIKQIQNDTLSHFVLSRVSTFSLAATGDLTYPTECLESSQIYLSNSQETPGFIARAFANEKYSQIPEFITFEDRLENSLQRDLVKVEHVRMRLIHEPVTSELFDMELIELKFIFDRGACAHHDNRDFEVLPDYQPRSQPSFNQQTMLFHKDAGPGWLSIFLKVYIRAFQHASNLDENAEDKILVGDRPKQNRDPLKLKGQLVSRRKEELEELTPDELSFVNFATSMADWLEPYHDYTRPPHATALAETSKHVSHPVKTPNPRAQNGTNGQGKKEEEAPRVKEPPPLVSSFFEDMQKRFKIVQSEGSVSAMLHVVNLTQEAFVLLIIETDRFKQPSVAKVYKLGTLVQSTKDIRTKAHTILREMSTGLQNMAELEGAKRWEGVVDACKSLTGSPENEIDSEFILGVGKKVADARKKVLEGVGKGIARMCAMQQ